MPMLLASGTGTLMGPSRPRLPLPPLLALDEVWDLSSGQPGGAKARTGLARLDWVFASHFSEDPVLPGSFMVEALLQLLGVVALGHGYEGRPRAVGIGQIRFLRADTPEDGSIEFEISVKRASAVRQMLVADGEARVGTQPCVRINGIALRVMRAVSNNPSEGQRV
ncbi:MAG: hypothetical protein WCP77_02305 [Roseococcus sp.]